MRDFAEGEEDFPRMPPVIVFKAQPEGYDDEDSDWEGDVEVAPFLDADEKDGYDPRVMVINSKQAYMGRQQCRRVVRRILGYLLSEKESSPTHARHRPHCTREHHRGVGSSQRRFRARHPLHGLGCSRKKSSKIMVLLRGQTKTS